MVYKDSVISFPYIYFHILPLFNWGSIYFWQTDIELFIFIFKYNLVSFIPFDLTT